MNISQSSSDKIPFECKSHKNFDLQYIYLNGKDEEDILLCNRCIDHPKYFGSQINLFQQIQNLLQSDDQTILFKWPPLNNQHLLLDIEQYFHSHEHEQENYKEIIIAHFDLLQKEINKHIEDQKKQVLIRYNHLDELKDELFSTYNQIAEKQKIIETLLKSENHNEAQQKIKEILKQKEEQKQQNEESLQKIYCSYQKYVEQLNKNKLDSLSSKVLYIIKNMTYFPDTEHPINQNQNQIGNDNENKEIVDYYQVQQVKYLQEQIKNPFNFNTGEFQNSMVEMLNNISPLFDRLDISNILQKDRIPINEKTLQQEQIDLLYQLIQKMTVSQELKKKQEYNHQLLMQYLFKQKHKEIEKQKKYGEIITLLPIFELFDFKMEFIISNYSTSQSNLTKAIQNDNTTKFTLKTNNDSYNIILSDVFLNKNKTYQIQFEISQGPFWVGLTSNGDNNHISQFDLCQSILKQNQGISDKINHIYTIKKGNQKDLFEQNSFQLTVNLSKSLLEISDYPDFNNTIEINDDKKYILTLNKFYQLGFSLYRVNETLLIKEIKEIEE